MAYSEATKEIIIELLNTHFSPLYLEVLDETSLHQGHSALNKNPQLGYFKITLKSEKFNDLSPIARHRLVYDTLKHLIDTSIHALSMSLLTTS